MWKQLVAAVICSAAVLAGSGAYFRSQLDAISSASANDPRFPKDRLHGVYILGVRSSISDFRDEASKEALKSAFEGAAVDLSGTAHVSFFYPAGDKPLAQYAGKAADHLRRCGADVTLRELSPVMLRSRAIAGKFDVFIAPSRVILRSDVARLGFMQLKAEDMGGWNS